jgi:hypothetical protein
LPPFIHNVSEIIRRVLFLARPYGRAKLAAVFSLSLAQALFQVIGITSIFPFLAIAADPERIRIAAHTLKGAAGNLSAHSLTAVASRLEHLSAEGNMPACGAACAELSAECDRVLRTLRQPRVH